MDLIKIVYLPNYDLEQWGEIEQIGGNACFDLRAAILKPVTVYSYYEKMKLGLNPIVKIPMGIIVELPCNMSLQVYPRSGMGSKGQILVHSPGVIDPSYRGEVVAHMINFGNKDFEIKPGDRILQAELQEVRRVVFKTIDEGQLSDTWRGENGFGHSGTR